MQNDLNTKYPLLLLHGAGFRDNKVINYWGRVPKALQARGARIYYGKQDAWATLEDNAKTIAQSLDEALVHSGAQKVNIIAHSKGGIEARYVISSLGYADKVASLTTISSPHHGSLMMDSIMRIPTALIRFAGFFVNLWFRILGDKKPNFLLVCKSFTTTDAQEFNQKNKDAEQVYYQSFAGAMKHSRSDMTMWFVHAAQKNTIGENDGLVSVQSAQWGHFGGVIRGQGSRGVSHADEVDMRRRNFSRKIKDTGEGHYNDMRDFYIKLVSDLCQKGF